VGLSNLRTLDDRFVGDRFVDDRFMTNVFCVLQLT
jgi:hypothetical protein